MDQIDVSSLCLILKDLIRHTEDEETKEKFVLAHIDEITLQPSIKVEFPTGEDWFNTTDALTRNHIQGKIVVLDFFTYCCINCLHILPCLKHLEENFSVADGLVVIGVHSAKFDNEKQSSNILSAIKKYNISHPVINDKDGYLWNELDVSCWPTLVILDPNGKPIFSLIGEGHQEELFLYVKCALKYYKNKLSPHLLPIVSSNTITSSKYLSFPGKITSFDELLAVSDSGHHRILIVNKEGDLKYCIGGKSQGFEDGSFEDARFNSPQGVVFYTSTLLYVADTENHAVRLIDLTEKQVTTVAGTGVQGNDYEGGKIGKSQEISSPWDICIVPARDVEVVFSNPGMFSMPLPSMPVPPVGFPPPPPPPPVSNLPAPPPPPPPPPLVPPLCPVPEINSSTNTQVQVLLIAMAGTHQIWALFLETTAWWKGKKYDKGVCAAIAGSGKEENRNNRFPMAAAFAQPSGLTYCPEEKCVFIADSESSSVRQLSIKDGNVSPVVGGDKTPDDLFSYGDVDGIGFEAKLQHPVGVSWNSKNKTLYVCDTFNHKIKSINSSTRECVTVHTAKFNEPNGSCTDNAGEILYVADSNNHAIKMVSLVDFAVKNLEIKEAKSQNQQNRQVWRHGTDINCNGGTLNLQITLKPEDIHGRWYLDTLETKVKASSMKGEITSEPVKLEFSFLPSESDYTIKMFFDLVLCQNDVCSFKKYVLEFLIKRKEDAKDKDNFDISEIVV